MKCQRCDDRGFYYSRNAAPGQSEGLSPCACLDEVCRCNGQPPYQWFDQDGQFQWCPCRSARLNMRKTQRLFERANVPEKYRWKFLDDFREKGPDDQVIKDAKRLKGYVASLLDRPKDGKRPRGYVFWGNPGNGKTLLACIALNELILSSGRPGRYIDLSFEYFQRLRSSYDQESEFHGHTAEIIEELGSVPFLVIDDFGVQRNTEWEKEMLYNLIDARYAGERLTFITTNRSMDEVKNLSDGRIYSRLVEMCHVVHVVAADYRLRAKSRPEPAQKG